MKDQFNTPLIPDLPDSKLGIVINGVYTGYEVEVVQEVVVNNTKWCYTESILNPYTHYFQMWFREKDIDYELYGRIYGEGFNDVQEHEN